MGALFLDPLPDELLYSALAYFRDARHVFVSAAPARKDGTPLPPASLPRGDLDVLRRLAVETLWLLGTYVQVRLSVLRERCQDFLSRAMSVG